jgi:transcriptional regulator with XRE-family HTH domain
MAGTRPLRYQILDPNETPPAPARRRYHRGQCRKTAQLRDKVAVVGQYLRACRLRQGRNGRGRWSLRSVANAAEMSHTTLCQVETGKRRAVADDLLRLADVLEEDREELLVKAGYLPPSALANRAPDGLTAAERRIVDVLRARPQLAAPLSTLLARLT